MPLASLKKARVKFMLFILAFMCPLILPAQSSIEGVLRDARQSLPFVTVVLQNADSVFIEGIVTDSAGRFVFENVNPGYYQVAASRVGYSRFLSGGITVPANQKIRLPEIVLEEVSTFLDAVEIRAEKQLFDQRPDRLVINPQSSLTFAGNTVLEVLRKSPGILVNRQDGSISMNGKSGVRVMINDRIMELPPDVVAQMLDAMSAANVERVELITAPPAEYDAQGAAGIIRVLTKKEVDTGTNAAFGATVGAAWAETLRANFNLYHRTHHFAYFVDYAVLRNHNLHLMDMGWESSTLPLRVENDSHRENITTRHSFNTGFEWQLTKNTVVSLVLSGYTNAWNLDAFTHDTMRGDSTVFTAMKIKELNNWGSATASIGLQRKAGRQGELNLMLDYLYYNNDNPSRYNNTVVNEQAGATEYTRIALDKTTPIGILIGRADYRFRVSGSLSGEAGVKGVTSSLDNNVRVQQLKNNSWISDETLSSHSGLSEQVYAAYASLNWRLGRQWQLTSGLRYENSHTLVGPVDGQNRADRRYGYFFPTVILRKNVDAESDYQVSCTRRITRPTYNDIAPYVFLWGPNTFSAGNTALYPAIADGVVAAYHRKGWRVSLSYTHVGNEIASLQPEVDAATRTLTFRSQNLASMNTVAFTTSHSVYITPWWDSQSHVTLRYQAARAAGGQGSVGLDLYGIDVNLLNRVNLPGHYALEISGTYRSRSLSGISQFLPAGSLNAGVQKDFGERGTIRLSMDDILYTDYWRIRTRSPEDNLDSFFNYNWHNRVIRITYTRSVGNSKVKSIKPRSGSQEERERVRN